MQQFLDELNEKEQAYTNNISKIDTRIQEINEDFKKLESEMNDLYLVRNELTGGLKTVAELREVVKSKSE